MATDEATAYPILRKHDVDYLLVIFGGLIGYSGSVAHIPLARSKDGLGS